MLIPLRKIYCITFSCELCLKHYAQIKDDKYNPIQYMVHTSNMVLTDLTTNCGMGICGLFLKRVQQPVDKQC